MSSSRFFRLSALCTGVVASSCSSSGTAPQESDVAPPTSTAANAVITDVQARFRVHAPEGRLRKVLARTVAIANAPLLADAPVVRFAREGNVYRADPGRSDVRVALPERATGAVTLTDTHSALSISVRLRDARDVPANVAKNFLVYPGAVSGGSAIHRVASTGTEDFIYYAEAPAKPSIAYDVTLGSDVAAVRNVGGTVEFVDANGAPRIRVNQPWVADASGVKHEAKLEVVGCAVDRDGNAPWGRKMPSPGASTCEVRVSWSGELRGALLVDPTWTTTLGAMTSPRFEHVAVPIPGNKVLIAGGLVTFITPTSTAEIYDAASRIFSATDSMSTPRGELFGAPLPGGNALIAGGIDVLLNALTTAEIYVPGGTPLWQPVTPAMHGEHSTGRAAVLPNNDVLIVGGPGAPLPATTVSDRYVVATGTWQKADVIASRTHNAIASNGTHVLVAGGSDDAGDDTSSAEVYNIATNTWSAAPSMSTVRWQPAAHALDDGRIIVAGGYIADTSVFLASTEVWSQTPLPGGTFAVGAVMPSGRRGFDLMRLPSGQLLAATGATSVSAIYDPSADVWSATVPTRDNRASYAAARLASGEILVTGGNTTAAILPTAEVFCEACGDAGLLGDSAPPDTGTEDTADSGDAVSDTADATTDSGTDATTDTGPDATTDTGPDATTDSGADATTDTGPDALIDAPVEAADADPAETVLPDTTPADTGVPETFPADADADTGIFDSAGDTEATDTETPDTAPADTGPGDTALPDTGTPDAALPDAADADTGTDTTPVDSAADTEVPDTLDTGSDAADATDATDTAEVAVDADTGAEETMDAGEDAELPDTRVPDTGADAKRDADAADADAGIIGDLGGAGCGCRTTPSNDTTPIGAALGLGVAAILARRRRHR